MTSTDTPHIRVQESSAESAGRWLNSAGAPSAPPRRSRRRLPHLVLGLLLVVVCVGGALWWTAGSGDRVPVLVVARPVTVGQVLTSADLRTAEVAVPWGVATVPAEQVSGVLGRPMATSLAPGALLTPDSVGAAAIPALGRAVAAVAVKPGQFPPELSPGAPVTVVVTADTAAPAVGSAGQGQGVPWRATVIGVSPAGTDQATVVSLELESTAATQLAQVPAGQLALVMQTSGGTR
ncbi:SAF domain-containing protein [Amycolatopsis tucumanensis]|uniref:SAF domain-containing protein n=1 Tax=Amycolatopsis tucumanensis TaxID=401106 RepID=UPI001F428ACB|nr:SAF domain-containing protein [Amycolatopsis tucumanensis]MCF6424971.1 SAF domain-containing protein [Amycolatopsis tucumanensis]